MRSAGLLLVSLCACAPRDEAPAVSPVAGCRVEEARYVEGEARPWRLDVREWDADGRLVLDDRTLLPGDPEAMHEVYTSTFEDGLLVGESERVWQDPRVVPTTVSVHTLDEWGLPRSTAVTLRDDDGAETPIGTFDWKWDIAGHLAEKALSTPDGDLVQVLSEVWDRGVHGWVVEREEHWADGTPLTAERRELDEDERPLRVASDWDADGTVEELLLWTRDALGRERTLDRSGTGVIDSRCDYTWRGDELWVEVCWDSFRDATYTTRWTSLAPGRPALAVVTEGEDTTEVWSYDWDCPSG